MKNYLLYICVPIVLLFLVCIYLGNSNQLKKEHFDSVDIPSPIIIRGHYDRDLKTYRLFWSKVVVEEKPIIGYMLMNTTSGNLEDDVKVHFVSVEDCMKQCPAVDEKTEFDGSPLKKLDPHCPENKIDLCSFLYTNLDFSKEQTFAIIAIASGKGKGNRSPVSSYFKLPAMEPSISVQTTPSPTAKPEPGKATMPPLTSNSKGTEGLDMAPPNDVPEVTLNPVQVIDGKIKFEEDLIKEEEEEKKKISNISYENIVNTVQGIYDYKPSAYPHNLPIFNGDQTLSAVLNEDLQLGRLNVSANRAPHYVKQTLAPSS